MTNNSTCWKLHKNIQRSLKNDGNKAYLSCLIRCFIHVYSSSVLSKFRYKTGLGLHKGGTWSLWTSRNDWFSYDVAQNIVVVQQSPMCARALHTAGPIVKKTANYSTKKIPWNWQFILIPAIHSLTNFEFEVHWIPGNGNNATLLSKLENWLKKFVKPQQVNLFYGGF